MASLGNTAVGSIVKLNVGGVATNFVIVHQGNPSTSLYGGNPDGTWVLMENIYNKQAMDTANNNITRADILPFLTDTAPMLFDSEIQANIQEVKLPYINGIGSSSGGVLTGANGLAFRVFILGGYEVGATTSDFKYLPVDGACLDYFKNCTNDKRIAYYNGTAIRWWLRSPNTSGSTNYWLVEANGSIYTSVQRSEYGVRLALVLNSALSVSGDGTISVKSSAITGRVIIGGVQRELTGAGYINIGGVLRDISDSGVNIGGTIKSLKG